MTLLPLIVIRLGSPNPVSKCLAAEINQQLRTHFSYRHYLVISEYEACKSGCITRHTCSVNFATGYCFLMVKASQSTGLVLTFFARPQYALFLGTFSSMVSTVLRLVLL
jgi:hypothetical protein